MIREAYGAIDEVFGLRGRWRRNAKWSLIGGTTQSCEGSWMNLFLVDPCPCHAKLDSWFGEGVLFKFSSHLFASAACATCPLQGKGTPCQHLYLISSLSLHLSQWFDSTHDLQDPWWSWLPSKGAAVLHTVLMLVCLPVPKRSQGESTWHRRHGFLLLNLWFSFATVLFVFSRQRHNAFWSGRLWFDAICEMGVQAYYRLLL